MLSGLCQVFLNLVKRKESGQVQHPQVTKSASKEHKNHEQISSQQQRNLLYKVTLEKLKTCGMRLMPSTNTACDQPHFNIQKNISKSHKCDNAIDLQKLQIYRQRYKFISRNGPGRKATTLNKAHGMALLHSFIGATQFQEICLRIGINSGSETSLQRLINESDA